MAQNIRRSQFITTYGPGAILEGPEGPKVIPSLDLSELFINRNPVDFEIRDLRLSQSLLDGAGIFYLPSNAELGLPENTGIYKTKRFPTWSLCVNHKILYRKTQGNLKACPQCNDLQTINDAWSQANRQAIRFVLACPEGHMDDVDWVGLVHKNNSGCTASTLIWRGGGGALRNVTIECPVCHQSANLGIAYSRTWQCSGRFPEREATGSPVRPRCTAEAHILQRGAANLRISEIQTALTIPPRTTSLHRLLEMFAIRAALSARTPTNKSDLLITLGNLVRSKFISQAILDEVQLFDQPTIMSAIQDIVAAHIPADLHALRLEEFQALKASATHGHPAQPSAQPGGAPLFEIIQSQVRTISGHGVHQLRITPVNRLRVVMVQKGYRRVPGGDAINSALVPSSFIHDGRNWFPGVELFGEGIFIDMDIENHPENRLQLSGQISSIWMDAWMEAWTNPQNHSDNSLVREDCNQLHPVFVWWHTFAHRLINALAVDSGYSSAAIRERIFIDVNTNTGEANGGILLYTAQPGGDGTLGGLIALVPDFERVITCALRNIDACSNDPLCGEERFSRGKYNGAACYACSLISETSCEHRNTRLDRNLLLQNLP
jgi:hypothetical protein